MQKPLKKPNCKKRQKSASPDEWKKFDGQCTKMQELRWATKNGMYIAKEKLSKTEVNIKGKKLQDRRIPKKMNLHSKRKS